MVQTQTTKLAMLAGLTSAAFDPGCTRTHSCGVGAVDVVGEGLGLGFLLLVGDGDGLGLLVVLVGDGLGLEVLAVLEGDGLGLEELPSVGEGELEADVLGLTEPPADGLALEPAIAAVSSAAVTVCVEPVVLEPVAFLIE